MRARKRPNYPIPHKVGEVLRHTTVHECAHVSAMQMCTTQLQTGSAWTGAEIRAHRSTTQRSARTRFIADWSGRNEPFFGGFYRNKTTTKSRAERSGASPKNKKEALLARSASYPKQRPSEARASSAHTPLFRQKTQASRAERSGASPKIKKKRYSREARVIRSRGRAKLGFLLLVPLCSAERLRRA